MGVAYDVAKPTAGVTVRHGTPQHFERHYSHRFCTVRDPLAWAKSWFRFQTQKSWPCYEPDLWHPQRAIEDCQASTFEEFLHLLCRRHPGYVSRMMSSYTEGCDIVMEQETLRADLADALERFGYGRRLASTPLQNVSDHTDTTCSQQMINRFWEVERTSASC
jgi:hypothetical protein